MLRNDTSEFVSGFGETIGEVVREVVRFVLMDAVARHEFGEIRAIDTARDIVPCWDGWESARVVVEADRIVEPGCLRCQLAEAFHAFRAIKKPPSWP